MKRRPEKTRSTAPVSELTRVTVGQTAIVLDVRSREISVAKAQNVLDTWTNVHLVLGRIVSRASDRAESDTFWSELCGRALKCARRRTSSPRDIRWWCIRHADSRAVDVLREVVDDDGFPLIQGISRAGANWGAVEKP